MAERALYLSAKVCILKRFAGCHFRSISHHSGRNAITEFALEVIVENLVIFNK